MLSEEHQRGTKRPNLDGEELPSKSLKESAEMSDKREDDEELLSDDCEDGDDADEYAFVSEMDDVEKKKSHSCLTESEIAAAQDKEVANVSEVLNVAPQTAFILLRHFRWNQETLISRFFEDQSKVLADAGLSADVSTCSAFSHSSGLSTLKGAPAEISCQICYDDPPEGLTKSPSCGHSFCAACWRKYLELKISEGESKKITCPGVKCKSLIPEELVRRFVNKASFDKYKSFLARSFVDDNPNVKWCPAPNCGRAVSGTFADKLNVQCSCGYKFCFHCNQRAHAPATCNDVKQWYVKCKDDSETYHWLSANTQDCPICKSAIEKNGGCNHMTCKQCKHEFCWVCQGDWKSHNDYYSCNRYDKKDAQSKDTSKQKSKDALERYLHYYHRYINHENSLKLEVAHRQKAEAKMQALQASDDHSTWIDVQYIQRAMEQLLECRHVLMYTYVFAYYLTDQKEKALFEYLQEMLETSTEKLAEMLEADPSRTRRGDVMNQTRTAATQLKNLLEGVANGLTTSSG